MTIRAAHYGQTEDRLTHDPIVIEMAVGLAKVPRSELAHDSGTPRHEFMVAANQEYAKRGGTDGGHIGAVATALLKLLDTIRQHANTARQTTITVQIPGWGSSTVTSAAMDSAIQRYLPASPAQLRQRCIERGGGTDKIDAAFTAEISVSAFLVVLADWDHNTDGDPLSVG